MRSATRPAAAQSPFDTIRYNIKLMSSLTVRTVTIRFGAEILDLVWAFAEPALYIVVLLAVRTYASHSPVFGDNQILFLATGLITLRMCRSIASKSINAIKRNRTLLDSPVVHPIDVILASLFVEIFLWAAITAVFYLAIAFHLGQKIIYHHNEFAAALGASTFFAMCLGVFNAVVGKLLPVWLSLWRMMSLPIMITSGVFFIPAELPKPVLDILIWNPFLHCLEWVRQATYLDYHSVLDKQYLFTCSFIILFVGLICEFVYRDRLHKE